MAEPLVPSTAFADAWIQVDRTENPRFFVNLLDATRARLLERARTSPTDFRFHRRASIASLQRNYSCMFPIH